MYDTTCDESLMIYCIDNPEGNIDSLIDSHMKYLQLHSLRNTLLKFETFRPAL